eukprot:gene5800-9623_t
MKRKRDEQKNLNNIKSWIQGGDKKPKTYKKQTASTSTEKRTVFKTNPKNRFNSFSSGPKFKPLDQKEENVDFSNFSKDQQEVLKAAIGGQNIFFTGSAGTGKSHVLREIVKQLKREYSSDSIAIVAPTGIAALNIGGTTLHSFAGIGLGNLEKEKLLKSVQQKKFNVKRWNNTEILIIDEISMLSGELFDKVEYIARRIRNSSSPFGGIQVILVGDFFQLPPVNQNGTELDFCFESKSWKSVVQSSFELKTPFRQNDKGFIQILNEIRVGKVSEKCEDLLKKCQNRKFNDKIEPTILYPHKVNVNELNKKKLSGLPGEVMKFEADDIGKFPQLIEQLDKSCAAPKILELKVNSQVILLKNLDERLVNGSRGVIVAFSKDNCPIVKFHSNYQREIEKADFEMRAGNDVLAKRTQFPLALAWAISIHKSQGMTIDILQTKLDSVFEYGQGYVALSRCKSLEGLSILGSFDKSKIRAHPKVIDFYSNLQKDFKNVNDTEDEEFITNKKKEIIKSEEEEDLINISDDSQDEPKKKIESKPIIPNTPIIPVKKIENKLIIPKVIDISDENIVNDDRDWISNYENFREEKTIENKKDGEIIDLDEEPKKEEEEKKTALKCLNGLIIGAKSINNDKEHPITHLFKKNHWIESKKGSLLIYLPFTESVTIDRITFGTKSDETRPKEIKIYLNEGELEIEDLKEVTPQEQFKENVNNILFENKTKNLEDINILISGPNTIVLSSMNIYGNVVEE